MTEQELERALRAALPPLELNPALTERILGQIDPNPGQRGSAGFASRVPAVSAAALRKSPQRLWLPVAIAASALIAFGVTQWVQQQHQRQLQVRAQLLQGLTIASASLRDVRSAVLHNEDSAP